MADNIIISGTDSLLDGIYVDQGGVGDDRFWTKTIPGWEDVTEFVILYKPSEGYWYLYGAVEDDSESGFEMARSEAEIPSSTLPWELDWFVFNSETIAYDIPLTLGLYAGVEDLYPEFATSTETGTNRVRRLYNLGYL